MSYTAEVFKDSSLVFLAPRQPCFNHSCIIENFFVDQSSEHDDTVFVKRYTPVGDIQHGRVNRDHIRDLTKEEIMGKFQKWRQRYHDFPIILHSHGFNNETGEPIYDEHGRQWQKTWQALTRFDSNRNILRLSKALEKANEGGVFLTLTVDRSKSLRESWETIMKDWHTFEVRLKIEIRRAQTKNLQFRREILRQRLKDQKVNGKFQEKNLLFQKNNNLLIPFQQTDRNKIREEIKGLSKAIKKKIQKPVEWFFSADPVIFFLNSFRIRIIS